MLELWEKREQQYDDDIVRGHVPLRERHKKEPFLFLIFLFLFLFLFLFFSNFNGLKSRFF